jgi:hypothetical protein
VKTALATDVRGCKGQYAVVRRGQCSFIEKGMFLRYYVWILVYQYTARRLVEAGSIGMILINTDDSKFEMRDESTISGFYVNMIEI